MMRIGVYAGSFDPVTVGHEDVIRRAAQLCDQLLVVVMYNPAKNGCFTVDQRVDMLKRVTTDMPHVSVDAWDGLMFDYVRHHNANFVVRGLRGMTDFESEQTLAQLNSRLLPGLETVFLLTKPELACVSSSAVKEAALFNADYSSFVPACILPDLKKRFEQNQ